MTNVIELTQELIRFESVTPKDEGAQEHLAKILEGLGFECHHLPFGEGDEKILNLFARLGTEGPHICFAGHTDVVPPGPEDQWKFPPFDPQIENGVLYGRGVADMKGTVAAYVTAVANYLEKHGNPPGSISLLITGDEEGVAINGTAKVLEWMKENDHVPDVALIGEPSNPRELGQQIKVGRRGSLTGFFTVEGKQGHVAYPQRGDNPVPRLVKLVGALTHHVFDEGSEYFQPTNLEFTTVDVGNPATNVIPAAGKAAFNIRFNNHWSCKTLSEKVREILDSVSKDYEIEFIEGSESFITEPGPWSEIIKKAVEEVSGKTPEYTTEGGTSDARFIFNYCQIAEYGPINATIHQVNENTEVQVLEDLTKTYTRILELYFG